jgi:hypothetical protein
LLGFADDGQGALSGGGDLDMDDLDTSEDDEDGLSGAQKGRDVTVALLRNNKNLVEPRTSQGTFGPNGMFHCLGLFL